MRTLLIPPFFMAIYAVALLSITWLITPGIQLASYNVAGCFLAGRMDLPPTLRRAQTTGWASDYGDEESFENARRTLRGGCARARPSPVRETRVSAVETGRDQPKYPICNRGQGRRR